MPEITEMWAWVADEGDSDEGVVAFLSGDTWHPMVGADKERMESLRPTAVAVASMTGKPVSLMRFSGREVVETLEPPE